MAYPGVKGGSVRRDNEAALRIIRLGGVIVWHDYVARAGVTRCLSELKAHLPIVQPQGSTFACLKVTEDVAQNLKAVRVRERRWVTHGRANDCDAPPD